LVTLVFSLVFIAAFVLYYPSILLFGIALDAVLSMILWSLLRRDRLSLGIYYCPNDMCPYAEKVDKGNNCPVCGTEARKFGIRQSMDLLKEKHKQRQRTNRPKPKRREVK
jgi:hypothetical protein